MAKTTIVTQIDPRTFELQDYSLQDDLLITNFVIEPIFNPEVDYVSYFIYDLNSNIVSANEINYEGYSIIDNDVIITPEFDVESAGIEEGQYNVVYNFLTNHLSSSFFQRLYIDEISSDRTEVRLNTTQISNFDLISGTVELINKVQNSAGTYFDFYLNFGDNQLVIANNILLDNTDPNDPTVLIKLYEPLPLNFDLKDECWVSSEVAAPVAYNIDITQIFDLADENVPLQGPNLNLQLKDQINNSTEYTNYSTLVSSSYATGSSNLKYQINSILEERGIEINVDYSNYSNFVYLSSADVRLFNFASKLALIEEYTVSASFSSTGGNSTYVTSSMDIWQSKIDAIITTFDGYDYHLYYNSGSTSWPKSNSTYPYVNYGVLSSEGLAFLSSQSAVATNYDDNNNNALINAVPTYLREDSNNAEYELFVEMLGEMFDNIWIYYQDVTNKFNADNRLNYGVSKDLVADILRDLGLKIYQNNFSSQDLYTAFLGVTPSGGTFPFPYITGSLPASSGFEYIDTFISASNSIVPLDDVNKSLYKRLYHNLPYLLKKKGTTVGIQNLITTYGIPDTILKVSEFGGKDKNNSLDWDYWQHKYNYKYDTLNNGVIHSEWALNSGFGGAQPQSVQLRFKLPTSSSYGAIGNAVSYPSQSLWTLNEAQEVGLVLEYTGSGFTSGSYNGSIPDPYNQYATLKFIPDAGSSASVYLPFFNGDWWSVMVTVDQLSSDPANYTLYAANSIYDGDDGSTIGFIASSSVSANITDGNQWSTSADSYFPTNGRADATFVSKTYTPFSGSYQEIRYFTNQLSQSAFIDFTMNPDSIEGNRLNTSPDELAFRAALGGELYTGSTSIHPKNTGPWATTSSFSGGSTFDITDGSFTSNTEYIFLDQPAVGIKNIVSNKIHIVDNILPSGDTLSPFISIQQTSPYTGSYTENLAYTEVAFSPQNEINDDIMNQLGFFNIGEYIGDPRQRFNQDTSYPDLDALRNAYFEKYSHNYDLNDYVRLIKYFDNSLFKMIQDWIPARSSLAAGVVVKQNILERNKYPQPEVDWARYEYSSSIDMAFISGGDGGSTPSLAYGGITKVQVNYGGTLYTGSTGLYPITISGGGGEGALLTPNLKQFYNLDQGTELKNSIIQNSSDATTGGDFVVTNQNGSQVTLRITIGGSSEVSSAEVRSATATNLDFTIDDIITIPTSDIGGTTDVLIQLQDVDFNGVYKGYVTSVNILNPGKNYSSFPTLTITGTAGEDAELEVVELDNSIVTQTWYGNNITPYGLMAFTQSSAEEFYTGEYSGSEFVVENGELNEANPFKQIPTTPTNYTFDLWSNEFGTSEGTFLSTVYPTAGTASFWCMDASAIPLPGQPSPYIKWAKIHTTDLQGNNNILSLQSLESFVARNFNPGNFTVLSISQGFGGEYYTFLLAPGNQSYTFPGPPVGNVTLTNRNLVFNPYITSEIGPFQNSDYNATINNAVTDRVSTYYQEIDYNTNQLIPVNFNQLISGSATRAAVQDSNYTSYKVINSRYNGSKNTSDDFNDASIEQSQIVEIGNYPKDLGTTINGLPSVNLNRTYFGYFNWAGGTAPEWGTFSEDKTSYNLRYLIDENGNVIKPIDDSRGINLGIVNQNFTEYTLATSLLNDTSLSQGALNVLNGSYNIFKSGKVISPILYSQYSLYNPSGSVIGYNYTSSIGFYQPYGTTTVTDWNFNYTKVGSQTVIISPTTSRTVIPFTSKQFDQGNRYNGNEYTFNANSDTQISFKTNLVCALTGIAGSPIGIAFGYRASLDFSIEFQPGGLGAWLKLPLVDGLNHKSISLFGQEIKSIILESKYQDFATGDKVRVVLNSATDNFVQIAGEAKIFGNLSGTGYNKPSSNFTLTQEQAPTGQYTASANYWTTGSSPDRVLTGSEGISYYYGLNAKGLGISGSGFNPIVYNFQPQPYDEIRFEGVEGNSYKIIDVKYNGRLYLTLDRPINLRTNINYFLIRRYVDDPAYIILDVDKPEGNSGTGIIKPEFLLDRVENNINEILQNLEEKGLITS